MSFRRFHVSPQGSILLKPSPLPSASERGMGTRVASTSEGVDGRGRDEDFSSPPAQIPACAANAPGSSLRSDVVR
jgi:hypothetical protein